MDQDESPEGAWGKCPVCDVMLGSAPHKPVLAREIDGKAFYTSPILVPACPKCGEQYPSSSDYRELEFYVDEKVAEVLSPKVKALVEDLCSEYGVSCDDVARAVDMRSKHLEYVMRGSRPPTGPLIRLLEALASDPMLFWAYRSQKKKKEKTMGFEDSRDIQTFAYDVMHNYLAPLGTNEDVTVYSIDRVAHAVAVTIQAVFDREAQKSDVALRPKEHGSIHEYLTNKAQIVKWFEEDDRRAEDVGSFPARPDETRWVASIIGKMRRDGVLKEDADGFIRVAHEVGDVPVKKKFKFFFDPDDLGVCTSVVNGWLNEDYEFYDLGDNNEETDLVYLVRDC